jgi:thioesterase domain-containing protein
MLHPDGATLLHAMFGGVLELDLDQLREMPEESVLRYVFDRAVDRRVLPPGTSLEQLERVLHVAQAHSRLLPPPAEYSFTISLLRARQGATRVSELSDLGWTPHADAVTVAWVNGSHETMLEPQHVDDVAKCIVDALVEPMTSV